MAKKTNNKKAAQPTPEERINISFDEIEKELKEEYKDEVDAAEKILNDKGTIDLSVNDKFKLLDEYRESTKNIENITTKSQSEMEAALTSEIDKATELQEKLKKEIAELTKKLTPQQSGFLKTDFWNGSKINW